LQLLNTCARRLYSIYSPKKHNLALKAKIQGTLYETFEVC